MEDAVQQRDCKTAEMKFMLAPSSTLVVVAKIISHASTLPRYCLYNRLHYSGRQYNQSIVEDRQYLMPVPHHLAERLKVGHRQQPCYETFASLVAPGVGLRVPNMSSAVQSFTKANTSSINRSLCCTYAANKSCHSNGHSSPFSHSANCAQLPSTISSNAGSSWSSSASNTALSS